MQIWYWFYKNKIYFLNYIILTKKIKIKNKEVKTIKNWSKLRSRRNI